MKDFWQHDNGKVYAVRSDSFGRITGAAGPFDPNDLGNPEDIRYGPAIVDWVKKAKRDDKPLKDAMARITSCADVQSVANTTQNVRAQPLDDINIDELGPEGKSMVQNAEIGQPTDIFAAGNALAVMYVCRREEGAEALPSRDDLKSSLKGRELNMISERELRNLRREATIIYR